MKSLHVVGGAIRRGAKVLAALRGPQMSHPNVWEFPGGKVEEGESPESCLRRELKEELGVKVTVDTFIARGESLVGGRRIVLDVYECKLGVEEEPCATEHAELRWVAVDSLDELAWAEADLPAVHRLMSGASV